MNIADALGITRNTVGLIEYRGENNILEARLMLASLMGFAIKPAFGDEVVIILGKTERCPYEYETRIENGWSKIALSIYHESVLSHQEVRFTDNQDDVYIQLNLNDIDRSICLDGYGIIIDIERNDVALHLSASNPRNQSIMAFADNIIGLARKYMIESRSIKCLKEVTGIISCR